MKQIFMATLTLIIFALAATIVTGQTNGPPEIKYTPKMGSVTFDHAKHQSATECATCHHTGDFASCKSCHGVAPEAPKAKVAFHNQCKSCHKELKKGPTKCKECHIK